ncbi:hypothetical protein PSHT_06401, partial [Puccinia striiformis]
YTVQFNFEFLKAEKYSCSFYIQTIQFFSAGKALLPPKMVTALLTHTACGYVEASSFEHKCVTLQRHKFSLKLMSRGIMFAFLLKNQKIPE